MISLGWIDKQLIKLSSSIGLYKLDELDSFFFEPEGEFYNLLKEGRTSSLNKAIKLLAKHIDCYSVPIIEEWDDLDNPITVLGQHQESNSAGYIKYLGLNRSRISINIQNKFSPNILAAIIAHELTHHYLMNKGIGYDDIDENEKFTDLATVFIGLGKLTINGYHPITWDTIKDGKRIHHTYQVGYLSPEELALVIGRVCKFRSIPLKVAQNNLISKNKKLLYDLRDFENISTEETLLFKINYYINKIVSFIKRNPSNKKFLIITCNRCSQRLSLPRMKGKIKIKCSNCLNKFVIKINRE